MKPFELKGAARPRAAVSVTRASGAGLTRRGLPALAFSAVFLAAAACDDGNDEVSTNSGTTGATGAAGPAAVATAREFIAPYTRDPVWRGPTSSPAVTPGTHIAFVNQLPTEPLFVSLAAAAKEAAQALGWRLTELRATTLADLPQVFDQAVALKPDGIFFSNLEANIYPTITSALVASKIPTVVTGVLPTKVNAAYTHVVDLHHALQGELTGAAAVLSQNGDARLGVLGFAPGLSPTGDELIEGIGRFLTRSGGGSIIGTRTIDIPTVRDPSAVGQAAVAFAQSKPGLNTFFVGYDGTSASVVPALRQAGLLDRVHVLGYQGNPQQLGWVRDGGGQVADVAWPQAWATWAAFDDLNRILNKVEPPADDGVPVRLFTGDSPPSEGSLDWWSGDLDFRARYRSLWKVA